MTRDDEGSALLFQLSLSVFAKVKSISFTGRYGISFWKLGMIHLHDSCVHVGASLHLRTAST